jgi:hypothetical protein
VLAFAPQLGNTQYQLYVQQDSGSYTMCYSAVQTIPSGVTSGWVTLQFGLGTCSVDTNIGRLGLVLITDSSTSAPAPGTTTLWIDSLWIELKGNYIAGPFKFDALSSVNPSSIPNDYNQEYNVLYLRPSSPTPPSGSNISWRNN